MEKVLRLFINLIRISIGESSVELPTLSVEQWKELYTLARKQALTGVLSKAIESLPDEQRPPREVTLKWIVAAEQIKQNNSHLNQAAAKVRTFWEVNGFQNCILKGQGIAQLYPNPELRVPGDIDIWINGKRKDIISLIRKHSKSSHAVYHHIDGLQIDGVEVETHFTPSFMNNPFANRRLQRWIAESASLQFSLETEVDGQYIHTPTLAFNRVFILHHIYRHFFYEGIGLRQMMDLYYVLKQGFTKNEQEETIRIYNKLNLYKFARAAMYVLQEFFGLPKEFCIVPPDESYGRVLMSEIISGGNFGQAAILKTRKETRIQRGWRIIKRSLQFIKYEPLEVLWMPYFKIWNLVNYVRIYH